MPIMSKLYPQGPGQGSMPSTSMPPADEVPWVQLLMRLIRYIYILYKIKKPIRIKAKILNLNNY